MAPTGRSGTIKTLAALAAAMVIGAGVLILMETPPACLRVPLQAGETGSESGFGVPGAGRASPNGSGRDTLRLETSIRQTDVPIQHIKWRNIIVHDADRPGRTDAGGCHFLIGGSDTFGDGVIRLAPLWRQQLDGNHISVPGYAYNENSIGIRLLCDTRRRAPTPRQMAALMGLVRALQVMCQISSDHVYLRSELGDPSRPGRFFPAEFFRSHLITASR